MARAGVSAVTGRTIYGWEHCVQSLTTILRTELRERVQRRAFGSEALQFIDAPQNHEKIIDLYVAVAQAIEPRIVEGRQYGEPGFVLLRASLDASAPGEVVLLLSGVFFENGHMGDYSNPIERELSYLVDDQNRFLKIE